LREADCRRAVPT